jgi:hypothetical protein
VTFRRTSFLGRTWSLRILWRRSGLGLVELGAVFGDFQLEAALLFLEFFDLSFQPIRALLEPPITLLPPPIFLP